GVATRDKAGADDVGSVSLPRSSVPARCSKETQRWTRNRFSLKVLIAPFGRSLQRTFIEHMGCQFHCTGRRTKTSCIFRCFDRGEMRKPSSLTRNFKGTSLRQSERSTNSLPY